MENNIPDMQDVAFDLEGSLVPNGYAFALWDELVRCLPWLDAEITAGVIPLRGAESDEGILLARRAKLVLRLPAGMAGRALPLSGQELRLGSCVLKIGMGLQRPLQPFTTLHSLLVEGHEDEQEFLGAAAAQLAEMGVSCSWICGRHGLLSATGRSLSGYSLVLHDLKPEDSLKVQCAGLGGNRRFGCGIFVPYKTISRLE